MAACVTAADCSDDAGIGDPSLILVVPVSQFVNNIRFFVPGKYAYSYISVAAPAGASMKLDGNIIDESEFQLIAGTDFMTAVKSVEPGSHILESDVGVGLYVYGWDSYVSYGYPAAMGLSARSVE